MPDLFRKMPSVSMNFIEKKHGKRPKGSSNGKRNGHKNGSKTGSKQKKKTRSKTSKSNGHSHNNGNAQKDHV